MMNSPIMTINGVLYMADLSISFGAFVASRKKVSWSQNTLAYCKAYRIMFCQSGNNYLFRGYLYANERDAQMAAWREYLRDYYKKNGVYKERLR